MGTPSFPNQPQAPPGDRGVPALPASRGLWGGRAPSPSSPFSSLQLATGLTLTLGKDTWAFFTLWEKVFISFSQLLEVFTLFSPRKQQWKEAPALHKLPLDVAL